MHGQSDLALDDFGLHGHQLDGAAFVFVIADRDDLTGFGRDVQDRKQLALQAFLQGLRMFYRATWEFPKTRQHFTGPAPDHQNVFAISDDGCRD
jgi:hypothetical protein